MLFFVFFSFQDPICLLQAFRIFNVSSLYVDTILRKLVLQLGPLNANGDFEQSVNDLSKNGMFVLIFGLLCNN